MGFTRFKHRCWNAILVYMMMLSLLTVPAAGAGTASEQEIQAAIILKLTDFITWPPHSFTDSTAAFVLGIIGENHFEGLFDPFLGRQVQNKSFAVRHFADITEMGTPQILIISTSERHRAAEILSRVAGKPVLTIGTFPGFAEMGGLITFFRKPNNRISFKINLTTKQQSDLKISAFLMKMGTIVQPPKGEHGS